jgi:uncharacterized protein (TIGR02266 family)
LREFRGLCSIGRFALVDPNTRQGKRTPVTLKIKFKSETLEQFIERYAVDVSQGGIFIRTKEPLAVGTQMRFEFQLRDASPLIAGEGTVVWTRENDPSRPAIAPGMGVRFDRLAEGSQTVLERILSEKAKQAPQRTHESSTKPPLFTDTPTKVAPLPVQEALLEGKPAGKRNTKDFNDQHTPLPKPVPFHSDAEDFDEQAFEEATKVRALDELIAQTAEGGTSESGGATAIIPPDELAARRAAAGARADSTLADAPTFAKPADGAIGVAKSAATADRDSAPGLPSPPAAGAPRLLDATPSPRAVDVPGAEIGKTKLGFDAPRSGSASTPPKSRTTTPPANVVQAAAAAASSTSGPIAPSAPTRPSGMQAVATEPSGPRPAAPAKSSAVPIVILILVLLAAGAGGVWFFVLRPKAEEGNKPPTPGSGSVVQTGPGSQTPGSGSELATGPGSGSAKVETPPAGPVVDTIIASSVDKANVEIVGTDQKGPAPFTAKLEKDKAYKARITAPGFAATELDVKGGQEKQTAKLVAKPRFVAVSTEPAGALIFVDGSATGHTTPHEVELTKAQAAKKSVRITVRKSGFKQLDKTVAVADYQEEDSKLLASIEAQLTQQAVRPRPPEGSGSAKPPDGTGSGSVTPPDPGTGSGTTTPPNPGTGSGTTPPPPTGGSGTSTPPTNTSTTPPSGTGSASKTTTPATPPAATGSAASKTPSEPEPDFVKKP